MNWLGRGQGVTDELAGKGQDVTGELAGNGAGCDR